MFSSGAAMLTPKRPIILPTQATTWVSSSTGAYSITAYKNGVPQGLMYSGTNSTGGLYVPFVCYFGDGRAGSMQLQAHLTSLQPAGYTVWN